METFTVPIHNLRPHLGLPLPTYMTAGASGMDLRASLDSPLVLPPLGRALVPTGLAVALPLGMELQIRPRSGLALRHGVTCLNAPGTVDADYRGEVGVLLINLGEHPFRIEPGDRIAQAVLARVARVSWEEVGHLPDSPRGGGGFGHTGTG